MSGITPCAGFADRLWISGTQARITADSAADPCRFQAGLSPFGNQRPLKLGAQTEGSAPAFDLSKLDAAQLAIVSRAMAEIARALGREPAAANPTTIDVQALPAPTAETK